MPDPAPSDDPAKLRARIRELEAELNRRDRENDDDDDDRSTTRRVSDSWSDVRESKRDSFDRMFRGTTLASAEAVRQFAESLSSFADTVIRRNERHVDGDRSVRDIARRLPEDIVTSLADTIDDFTRIPSRAADRYARVYREGEKSEDRHRRRRDRDRDGDRDRTGDRDRPREAKDKVAREVERTARDAQSDKRS